MKLTLRHLDLYKQLTNRGNGKICNDLEPKEFAFLTHKEWLELHEAYSRWNGDVDEYMGNPTPYMMDFQVTSFIRYLLVENYIKNNGL